MEERTISKEEELHIDRLEDDVDGMEDDDFIYNACCCKDRLVEEMLTRDRIRAAVMPGTMLYDGDDVRKFLLFLSMYPAFATVYDVVEDVCAFQNDLEEM